MKVVRTYQQTFIGTTGYEWTFKWNKVYKQDNKNKLIISVSALASVDTSVNHKPHLFYLKGSSVLNPSNANSSALAVNGADPTIDYPTYMTNDCYLGVLGGGESGVVKGDIWTITTSKFIVDELPLDYFRVYYRHPDTAYTTQQSTDVLDGLFLAFEITEFREDD